MKIIEIIAISIGIIIISIIIVSFIVYAYRPVEKSKLAEIIELEINLSNLPEEAVCWDYTQYYNETLTEKYPELDVQVIGWIDICNNQTLCEIHHSFIVVGGYGSECILDQKDYACIDLR